MPPKYPRVSIEYLEDTARITPKYLCEPKLLQPRIFHFRGLAQLELDSWLLSSLCLCACCCVCACVRGAHACAKEVASSSLLPARRALWFDFRRRLAAAVRHATRFPDGPHEPLVVVACATTIRPDTRMTTPLHPTPGTTIAKLCSSPFRPSPSADCHHLLYRSVTRRKTY